MGGPWAIAQGPPRVARRAAYIPVELAEKVWAVGYMQDNGITLITLPKELA